MADYLLGLTQRTLGLADTLQPRIPSMFEAGLPMLGDQVWDWQTEPLATETATKSAASPPSLPLTTPLTYQPSSPIAGSSLAVQESQFIPFTDGSALASTQKKSLY